MRSLLVTGVAGFLGSQIAAIVKKRGYRLIATDLAAGELNELAWERMDITEMEEVRTVMTRIHPDGVIHCAALADVEYCEANKKRATEVNVKGTKNIASMCDLLGSKLIYVSTDQVFSGSVSPDRRYSEEDSPSPINYYGRSKLAGESTIKETVEDYTIARTANLYGYNMGISRELGVAYDIIRKLRSTTRVEASSNFYQTPTSAYDYGNILVDIFEKSLKGVYHIAGRDVVSRLEFAYRIADFFKLDRNLIVETRSSPTRNVALDCSKIQRALHRQMLSLEEGFSIFREILNAIDSGGLREHL